MRIDANGMLEDGCLVPPAIEHDDRHVDFYYYAFHGHDKSFHRAKASRGAKV